MQLYVVLGVVKKKYKVLLSKTGIWRTGESEKGLSEEDVLKLSSEDEENLTR